MMLESIPYLSVGLDVGADFTWMSIMLPNGILTGKPSVVRQALGKSMLLPSTMLYAQLQKMPLFSDVCFLAMHSVSRIRLYIKTYREYHAHLDSILKELHKAVDKLEGTSDYDRISLVQPLHGVGFLSAVVLIAEMGSFDQFSPPQEALHLLRLGSCRKAVRQQSPHVQKEFLPCHAYPAYGIAQ